MNRKSHGQPVYRRTHRGLVSNWANQPREHLNAVYHPAFSALAILTVIVLCLYVSRMRFFRSSLLWLAGEILMLGISIVPSRIIFVLDNYLNDFSDDFDSENMALLEHERRSQAVHRIFHSLLDSESVQRLQQMIFGSSRHMSYYGEVSSFGSSALVQGIKASKILAPPGLGNIDNSCYQNSVLQGLISLPSLSSFLDSLQGNGILVGKSLPVCAGLRATSLGLRFPSPEETCLWPAFTLKRMDSISQQDAQEYFSKVTDKLEQEMKFTAKLKATRTSLQTFLRVRLMASFPFLKALRLENRASHLDLASPLEGLLAQRVGCVRCGQSDGISMQSFTCLTLQPSPYKINSVQHMLDDYTGIEAIEGVKCGKCTLLDRKAKLEALIARENRKRDHRNDNGNGEIGDNTPMVAVNGSAVSLISFLRQRLTAVEATLDEAPDFSDFKALSVSSEGALSEASVLSTTKTRQCVIARPPSALVLHFNRSLFDEVTGDIRKNHAPIIIPQQLDLSQYCLGGGRNSIHKPDGEESVAIEEWPSNPRVSLLSPSSVPLSIGDHEVVPPSPNNTTYTLRAVVTHTGFHEDGHYICYRQHDPAIGRRHWDLPKPEDEKEQVLYDVQHDARWWEFSDADVRPVSEEEVLGLENAFMLFYERVEGRKADERRIVGEVSEKSIANGTEDEDGNESEVVLPSYQNAEDGDDGSELRHRKGADD